MFNNLDLETKLIKARKDCEKEASKVTEAAKGVSESKKFRISQICRQEDNCECKPCLDPKKEIKE